MHAHVYVTGGREEKLYVTRRPLMQPRRFDSVSNSRTRMRTRVSYLRRRFFSLGFSLTFFSPFFSYLFLLPFFLTFFSPFFSLFLDAIPARVSRYVIHMRIRDPPVYGFRFPSSRFFSLFGREPQLRNGRAVTTGKRNENRFSLTDARDTLYL